MSEENTTGIGGTEFQTPEELAAAFLQEKGQRGNLEKKLGEQGSELGSLRKQTEMLTQTLNNFAAKGGERQQEAAPATDYEKEQALIEKQISELDPADETYQPKLSKLIRQSNSMTAQAQHEKTLNAASQVFKKELDERDVKATQKMFLEKNPDFNMPEMQMRIRDSLANDQTGMLDSLSAFYQIQRDDAASAVKAGEAEKADLMKRLNIIEGRNNTGTVLTKGMNSAEGQGKQKTRLSGKEADEGALAALRAARGEA
jgi:hypothetical protein